jgi:hypothetical protein
MSKIKTAVNMLVHDKNIFCSLLVENLSPMFSDKQYLKLVFKYRMGYMLYFQNPNTFIEIF